MKHFFLLFLIAALALTGCGQTATPEATIATTAPAASETQAANQTGSYVDLTSLSSTMVYAEVFNMTTFPEDYVGKTVKMRGQFSTGKLYAQEGTFEDGGMVFACIIQDAAACCAQGIPFDLAESRAYPEEYPELGAPITVTGTFKICTQDGLEFCRLSQAELLDAEI